MKPRDLLALVFNNLKRMKGRVIMTALGVVIGTAAVIVLVSLGAGLQQQATEGIGGGSALTEIRVMPSYESQVGMEVMAAPQRPSQRSASTQRRLNEESLAEIRALSSVASASPLEQLQTGGELAYGRWRGYGQLVGVEPEYLRALETTQGTVELRRGQVVIGARVAENFYQPSGESERMAFHRPGAAPGEQPQPELYQANLSMQLQRMSQEDGTSVEKTLRLQVVGVLAPIGWQHDYHIYAPLREVVGYNSWVAGQHRDPAREGYGEVIVQAVDRHRTLEAEQAITALGFQVHSARQQIEEANTFFRILQAILGSIGAVALLVAAFGIANTMLMAIYERTREIGLMKAIGASNQDVMIVFLAESGAIGLLGGVGGALLGLLLTAGINLVAKSLLLAQLGGSLEDLPDSITQTPLWLLIFAILFAILIGVVSGAYPASRAAGLSPIKALKYE
ncbi:MAG: ABC transporter permease [Anaerolineae bacterium]|nr:ABC transporter permease [Anaerolineae bacterium]